VRASASHARLTAVYFSLTKYALPVPIAKDLQQQIAVESPDR
jgi:hypothetical protein